MERSKIIYVSSHAKERVKERCGISKKNALKYAEKAVSRGTYIEDTKGSLRDWLDRHIRDEGHHIYLYGDKVLIFSEKMLLVTVLQLPADLVRCSNNSKKKALRSSTAGSAAMA